MKRPNCEFTNGPKKKTQKEFHVGKNKCLYHYQCGGKRKFKAVEWITNIGFLSQILHIDTFFTYTGFGYIVILSRKKPDLDISNFLKLPS